MDNIQLMRELRRIYGEYLEDAARLEKDKNLTDGLLGFGKGAGTDPCHDVFSEKLLKLLENFAAGTPSSPEVEEVLRYIYDTPLAYKNKQMTYLMLQAVHVHTEKLVPFLSAADAASLVSRYLEAYPKSVRLPAQNKIAKLLQAQAGQSAGAKKSIFSLFRKQ